MIFDQTICDDLWSGEKSICFFVCSGEYFWILDYKYNFSLDAEKDYQAYLDKGHISQEQFVEASKEFRGGILKLTADNFLQYKDMKTTKTISNKDLREFIREDNFLNNSTLLEKVEKFFLFGSKLNGEDFRSSNVISSKLPMFYINFDRKIYMHMDWERSHEELAYSDWLAKASDFNFLIPDAEKYWVQESKDFWKLKFL